MFGTSEGNSAQSRSHMKMEFRYMKWRRLLFTQSVSIASMASGFFFDSERDRERESS
uniref:Uncharacterized protein MANES_03G025500 n=1 Tax=Rhizophora mucronata TaxID=61149 RepID=A0A2P2LI75_RHIMU